MTRVTLLYEMSRRQIDIDVNTYLRLNTKLRTPGSHNYRHLVDKIRRLRSLIFILFSKDY